MIIAGYRNLYKDDCSGLRKPAVPRDYSCGTYQVRNDEIKRLDDEVAEYRKEHEENLRLQQVTSPA